jgi:hypothetical protein
VIRFCRNKDDPRLKPQRMYNNNMSGPEKAKKRKWETEAGPRRAKTNGREYNIFQLNLPFSSCFLFLVL